MHHFKMVDFKSTPFAIFLCKRKEKTCIMKSSFIVTRAIVCRNIVGLSCFLKTFAKQSNLRHLKSDCHLNSRKGVVLFKICRKNSPCRLKNGIKYLGWDEYFVPNHTSIFLRRSTLSSEQYMKEILM